MEVPALAAVTAADIMEVPALAAVTVVVMLAEAISEAAALAAVVTWAAA